MMQRKHFLLVSALVVAMTASGGDVGAATFVVTKTADTNDGSCDADCSLREAIVAANGGNNEVSVPAGTYVLTIAGAGEDSAATGDLDVYGNVSIVGAGPGQTIVDGNAIDRVFEIIELAGRATSISGMTVRNGSIASDYGGGIYVGGAVGGSATLSNCVLSDNTSALGGGGVFNNKILAISGCTIHDNGDPAAFGGGIANGTSGTMIVENSTVTANVGLEAGGIINAGPSLELKNVTIAHNDAISVGGGLVATVSAGSTSLRNTLLAGNTSPSGSCDGTITSQGGNVDDDGTCNLSAPADMPNVADALIAALADNGGATQTHALLSGSPAIDAGLNAGCGITDQRGLPRADGDGVDGIRCDSGAFEVQAAAANVKCWKTKDLKNPKFVRQEAIPLDDEFSSDVVDVLKPAFVCNPADKDGNGIPDRAARQCCYKIKAGKTDPNPRVSAADDFGAIELEAKKAQLLCQPCATTLLP